MIMNLESDVVKGNKVPQYFYIDGYFVENDEVLLKEELDRDKGVFIFNNSLYAFKWYRVEHSDGFITARKIHYVVTDDTSNIPDEYWNMYSFERQIQYPDTVLCEDKKGNLHQ